MNTKYPWTNKARVVRFFPSIFLCSLCAHLFGCNAAMLEMMLAGQDPKVPAECVLTEGTVAIVIDDHDLSIVENPLVTGYLYEALADDLRTNAAAGKVVPYRRWQETLQADPALMDLSVSLQRIGQRLQADQVVHVRLTEFALRDRGGDIVYRARMQAAVKVIDVNTGNRVWPVSRSGKTVRYEGRFQTLRDTQATDAMTRQVCRQVASKIALFFYDHPRQKGPSQPIDIEL